MRLVTATLVAATLMSGAVVSPAMAASFIARPTEPLACPTAGASWEGFFHGQKETEWGFRKYEDISQRFCFRTEKLCKNWLYNMQSEYTHMVWSAVCRKTAG